MTLDDTTIAAINGRSSPKAPSGRDWPETAGIDICDEVTDIVTDYVETSDPFTAHTITRKLREKYPAVEIDHDEVRNCVHAMFANDEILGYDRERSHFSGSPYIYMYID